ncbi:MAG: hypothetical protein BAJATHORv1_20639 [Candidatus Thorarchaeota archaeon]|nr:MAG: hypothetical protein BAJATHORv1_20639 [Candidatus Thorarchaeota archaeon]
MGIIPHYSFSFCLDCAELLAIIDIYYLLVWRWFFAISTHCDFDSADFSRFPRTSDCSWYYYRSDKIIGA